LEEKDFQMNAHYLNFLNDRQLDSRNSNFSKMGITLLMFSPAKHSFIFPSLRQFYFATQV
jgi:hypothetical protein